jgi:hypothetical protein
VRLNQGSVIPQRKIPLGDLDVDERVTDKPDLKETDYAAIN